MKHIKTLREESDDKIKELLDKLESLQDKLEDI